MRFAVRLLTLAAAIAIVAAAPPPDPLAALAAANGHAALLHLRATGKRVVEGRTVTTVVDQLGPQRLMRRCINEVCGGTWFDGSREWTFGLNEVLLPEESDDATLVERTLAEIVSYAFAEPGFRAAGGTVAREGSDRWRVRARDGAELIALADPASRAIRRVEIPGGRGIASYGREARAGGATFALDRSGPLETGPLDDVAVVPGAIALPAGIAVAIAGDAALPLGDDPIPIVACTLGGRTARCLLDSGATPSAMTLAFAEALNLEPHGELEITGLGRFATGFVEAGPLELGPARFTSGRFAVVPQSRAARFDVVVGSDLLGRVRLVLDHGRRTVRVLATGGPAPPGPAVPVTFHAGSPVVQTMFGPQGARALVDTGDQAAISFGYAAYRQGPQWPVISRGQALGIAGADDTLTVDVPEVHIGSLVLGPTRATVRRTQGLAHVGIGLWDRFVVDLDEASGRLSFSPR
jgi:aspartyl protease